MDVSHNDIARVLDPKVSANSCSPDLSLENIELRGAPAGVIHEPENARAPTEFVLWKHTPENVKRLADCIRSAIEKRPYARSVRILYEGLASAETINVTSRAINKFLEGKISAGRLKCECEDGAPETFPKCITLAKELKAIEKETGLSISFGFIDRSNPEVSSRKRKRFDGACRRLNMSDKLPACFVRFADRDASTFLEKRLKSWRGIVNSLSAFISSDRNEAMLEQIRKERAVLPEDALIIAAIGSTHAEVAFRYEESVGGAEIQSLALPVEFLRLIPGRYGSLPASGYLSRVAMKHLKTEDSANLTEAEILSTMFSEYVQRALIALGKRRGRELDRKGLNFLVKKRNRKAIVRTFLAESITDAFDSHEHEVFIRSVTGRFMADAGPLMSFGKFAEECVIREVLPRITGTQWAPDNNEGFFRTLIGNLFPD